MVSRIFRPLLYAYSSSEPSIRDKLTSSPRTQQGIKQINAPFSEMIIAVMICRLILNLRSPKTLETTDEVYEISELQCATRMGPVGKAVNGTGSPTVFDLRRGVIGGSITDCDRWSFESGFDDSVTAKGKFDKYEDRNIA